MTDWIAILIGAGTFTIVISKILWGVASDVSAIRSEIGSHAKAIEALAKRVEKTELKVADHLEDFPLHHRE